MTFEQLLKTYKTLVPIERCRMLNKLPQKGDRIGNFYLQAVKNYSSSIRTLEDSMIFIIWIQQYNQRNTMSFTRFHAWRIKLSNTEANGTIWMTWNRMKPYGFA